MNRQEHIRETVERSIRAMEARASVGRGTATTCVRWVEGLRCDAEEGPWRLSVDMSEKSGGDNTAPNPGIYGRTSLGSCMVIGYAKWAAWRGIPLTSLEVDVEADYDARGEYGISDVTPAYTQVRCTVRVTSPRPEAEVRAMLEEADRHSPYLAVFRDHQDVRCAYHVSPERT